MKNDSMRIKVIMDHLMGLLAIEKETSLKFINIHKFKEENIETNYNVKEMYVEKIQPSSKYIAKLLNPKFLYNKYV